MVNKIFLQLLTFSNHVKVSSARYIQHFTFYLLYLFLISYSNSLWIEIRIKYLLWFWNNFSKSEVFDCDGLKHWLHGIGNIYSLDISTEGKMMNGDIIIIISSYFCDNWYGQGSWTSTLKDLFTSVNDVHVFSRLRVFID